MAVITFIACDGCGSLGESTRTPRKSDPSFLAALRSVAQNRFQWLVGRASNDPASPAGKKDYCPKCQNGAKS